MQFHRTFSSGTVSLCITWLATAFGTMLLIQSCNVVLLTPNILAAFLIESFPFSSNQALCVKLIYTTLGRIGESLFKSSTARSRHAGFRDAGFRHAGFGD